MLADAIYVSCAVPILFQPLRVQDRLSADGGVLDRHGMLGAESGEQIFTITLKAGRPGEKNSPALKVPH